MLELFILVAIVSLVVFSLRPRKPVLEEPLVIEQPGRYHLTLAPQLRGVQPFIENIVGHFAATSNSRGDTPTLFYRIHQAKLPGEQSGYLLAVALRGGVLYFQAINPKPMPGDDSGQLEQLREFSAVVLAYHSLAQPVDGQATELLQRAVEDAARQAEIDVCVLH